MFTDNQNKLLAAPLRSSSVMQRTQSGRKLSYIEGWHAIAEANRIFGFDGWMRETVELLKVHETPRKIGSSGAEGWGVTYIGRVRITVGGVVREGCGTGHGIDRDLGQAHESAVKEAETDAMKRALMTFGNQFGLALYDKTQANVTDDEPEPEVDHGPPPAYPLMLPGSNQPYTRVTTAELWVTEMNDMIGKIRNSNKINNIDREKKLTDLEAANQHIIDALPEELRNGLMI